jgi:hypothetical protein
LAVGIYAGNQISSLSDYLVRTYTNYEQLRVGDLAIQGAVPLAAILYAIKAKFSTEVIVLHLLCLALVGYAAKEVEFELFRVQFLEKANRDYQLLQECREIQVDPKRQLPQHCFKLLLQDLKQ